MPAFLPEAGPPLGVGRVSLVGAGPGDPDLLTFKAAKAIAAADVVLYDKLVGPGILQLASPGARLVDVGKRCGRHSMRQSEINRLLVDHALAGAHVVRLKGGDPFVFGRGGEELDALRAAGVPVEIVPGVTAACAAAASLGLPLTQRGVGRSLHLLTGHGADADAIDHDWSTLMRPGATVVVYMGITRLAAITAGMMAAGVSPDLPAVAVENASLPGARWRAASVGRIAGAVAAAGFEGPAILIFGEVAARARSDHNAGEVRRRASWLDKIGRAELHVEA